MTDAPVPVRIVGIVPAGTGTAVFLGNEEKTFSIHIDQHIGMILSGLIRGEKSERPLTHDLIGLIFRAFHITVERIIINDLRNDTYFARLTLKAENEVQKKITEIDARPSDCLAIALETGKPVLVARSVWAQVPDLSDQLEELKKKFQGGGEFDVETEEEDDEE
jgi:bifunctional DNase/RNase